MKMMGVSNNIPQPKPAPKIMAHTRVNMALVNNMVWLPLVAAYTGPRIAKAPIQSRKLAVAIPSPTLVVK